jgi:hypothetical protein
MTFLASLVLLVLAVASAIPYGGGPITYFILWIVASVALLAWSFAPLGRLGEAKDRPEADVAG